MTIGYIQLGKHTSILEYQLLCSMYYYQLSILEYQLLCSVYYYLLLLFSLLFIEYYCISCVIIIL